MSTQRTTALALLLASAFAVAEEAPSAPLSLESLVPAEDPAAVAPATGDAGSAPPSDATSPLEFQPIAPLPELPVVEKEPELQPPPIDAYLDPSFSSNSFKGLGIDDHATGFRFIAGFRLPQAEGSRWAFAPEVGYTRIGQGERAEQVIDTTPPGFPKYTSTNTITDSVDATSLDFGLRASWRYERVEVFSRAGLHSYHAAYQTRSLTQYKLKPGYPPDDPAPPDTNLPTQSNTDVGMGWFGALGVGIVVADIPTFYVEVGARDIGGNVLKSTSIGVLLNF